jgi:hypothetical protein
MQIALFVVEKRVSKYVGVVWGLRELAGRNGRVGGMVAGDGS